MKKIYSHILKTKFLLNSFLISSISLVVGFLNYFFQIISSRFLTEKEYVTLIAFLAIFSIFTAITSGFSLIVSRSISKIISEKKEAYLRVTYFQFVKYINIYLLLILIILFFFKDNFYFYFEVSDNKLIIILFILIFLNLYNSLNNSFFLGLKKFIFYSLSNLINAMFKNIVNLILLFFSFGILSGILGIAASLIATFILGVFFLREYLMVDKLISKPNNYYSKINSTWFAFILCNLGLGLMTQLDVVIAKAIFFDNADLHKFAAASVLAKAVLYLSGGIALSTFPQMSEDNYNKNFDNSLLKNSIFFSIFISVLSVIFFYIFGKSLIIFFFGKNYAGAEKYLFIYSLTLIPMSLILILEHYMMSKGKTFFIWILITITPLQVFIIYYFSESFYHIIFINFFFSSLIFLTGLFMLYKKLL